MKNKSVNQQIRVSHSIYSLLPTEVEGFDSLADLALDMRWSWNHCVDEVWRQLDPALWELAQNPWVVLQTVSREHLERVLANPAFRQNVDNLLVAKRETAEAPAWFQQHHPQAPLTCAAYFSMEFMLSEALPIYSGGLAIVAGDQLKAARKALGWLPLIADDLGATTPEVVALLDQLQIPGTRVLQFEFGSNLGTHSAAPAPHPMKSVVYTGTHDNDTMAGWNRKLPGTQRQALQKQLRANNREVVWAVIREALASPTDTAIVPAQDLLELGSEARMNFPGIAKGNWQWLLKDGALSQEIAQRLRGMTITHGRLSSDEPRPVPRCQEADLTPQIAKRVYELYERRGRQNGQGVQDWLQAEREIERERS